MQGFVAEMLQCPACHGSLAWRIDRREGDRIEEAEAQCRSCSATYPVREGIGIFLTPDLDRNDLWESGESRLLAHLREHPDIERRLMESPADSLNPTDRFYRASVLDLRGRYTEGRALAEAAAAGLYTPEYRAAEQQQRESLLALLSDQDGPIVDLASGRGMLALAMLERLSNPILLTDFSPRILRMNRRRLEAFGLYERVSQLSFDARRTPFRDGALQVMTTYMGLGNIEQPGTLLAELRRVVAGRFLAFSFFCPEEDAANADLLRRAGMEQMLFRRLALENFAAAGWTVAVRSPVIARVEPTPQSELFPGSTVDGFPVAPTAFEFCVLEAH